MKGGIYLLNNFSARKWMGEFLSSFSSETSSIPQALPLQGITITPSPAVAKGCLPSRTTSLLLGTAQTLRPAPLPCITLSSDRTCRPCRALQANSGYVNKMLSDTQRKYYNWPQQQRQHGVVFLSTILSSVVGLDTQDTCTRSQIETDTRPDKVICLVPSSVSMYLSLK